MKKIDFTKDEIEKALTEDYILDKDSFICVEEGTKKTYVKFLRFSHDGIICEDGEKELLIPYPEIRAKIYVFSTKEALAALKKWHINRC